MGEPQIAVRALVGKGPRDVVPLRDLPVPARDRRRDDWYVVHPDVWSGLREVPGLQFTSAGLPVIHRTMLPLVHRVIPDAVLPGLDNASLEDRAFDATTEPLGFALREYQHVARRRLRQYRRQLLADGMRMGKTVEILSAHEITDGPLLVIAPLATRKVWTDWMKRRWPHEDIAVCEGKTFDRSLVEGKNLIFIHYDIMGEWQALGTLPIGRIVLDEAHKVSKRKGRWMQALIMISTNVPNFVAATGTPLWNMPVDLWGALNIIAPGAWGTWVQYAIRYCGGRSGPYGLVCDGPTNSDEMRARMGELMLRRTWEDVSDQLPKIERSVEVIPVNKTERRKIDAAVEQLQTTTDHKTYVGKMAQYRRLLGELKVERTVDLAEELLRAEEPVVIWTWHVDIAERIVAEIQKAGHQASMICGRQSQSVRDNRIDTWRLTNGALVVTLSTGQAGIDLSHARHCIFAEIDWTPAVIAQAEMRTFMITRPMTVTYLAVDHEADQEMVNRLRLKLEISIEMQIPAADAAIDIIASAFGGPPQVGDLSRLLADVLAGDDGSEDLF